TPSYSLKYVLSKLQTCTNAEYTAPISYSEELILQQELERIGSGSSKQAIEARKRALNRYYTNTLTSLPTEELQEFVAQSIRGGYCSPTFKRIYIPKEGYYLICLDVNSLYPAAMLLDLALCPKPVINKNATRVSFFRQVANMEHFYDLLSSGRNSQYHFEVDLEIPDNIQESIDALPEKYRHELIVLKGIIDEHFNGSLHEFLRFLPPVIDSFTPTLDMLSDYNKSRL